MPDIGKLLDREARQIRPSPDEALEQIMRRARNRRRNRRVAAGIVGMALSLGVAGGLWAALEHDDQTVTPAASPTERPITTPGQGEPSPIGPKVQVASGKLLGRSWTLQAFLTEEGLCMALDSGLACGPSRSGLLRPESPILVVFTNTSYEPEQEFDATWVYGVVSPEVAELELVTEGGVAIPVSIVEKDIGLPVRFYVVALERAPSGGALIARGAEGRVLQEHEVHLD